ncbi:thioredoxin reductase [Parapedobacter defluvii]|uniref:Thioredoxin reductase n=1 Tax=Parapedobacter defluvii TaxID=2045106 RepID=A0ABQ1MIJ9_9SPHI|nr:NAD(P)/FAD-dependent oxidoreductase [Parapedobacter defluvii]RQP12050.1 MAG: NAD(P)/FAD-dependent oxidoreductase [Parapedobacter sp.]GGC39748.1 thioredoxin reductase [Parapedobacter defluvii]
MATNKEFDVIVIGGSYAGLSAAMALGRSLRSVLVLDSGRPCNLQTPHSHNFITQDGEKPATIAEKAKKQVLEYRTVHFLNGLALSGKKTGDGFVIATQADGQFYARKLIFATGISDIFPDIKGFAECWGISVIHCPYCHGYEFRGKQTGILANGERAFHITSLVNNLTDRITVLTSGKAAFNTEQVAKLNNRGIGIIETPVSEIIHENGHLKKVVLGDGQQLDFDAVYAAIPFTQHSDIPVSLGCELTENGHLKVDTMQKTTVNGVFACGDNAGMMRSVAYAVATGNLAGAMANHELTAETF